MMSSSGLRKWFLILVGALAVFALGFLAGRHFSASPNNSANPATDRPHKPGFREAAKESGITFRMAFLPSEQGENFKTNLYDHGCGVVVGDFDGDGHDDVYFLNQLGRNALYKNKGLGRRRRGFRL